jgi:hypothetical protein
VFFFGSFEGFRREQSLFTFFTVPERALRAGDFSGAVNTNGTDQQIYDPSRARPTASAGRSSRTTDSANRIDPSPSRSCSVPDAEHAGIGAAA